MRNNSKCTFEMLSVFNFLIFLLRYTLFSYANNIVTCFVLFFVCLIREI